MLEDFPPNFENSFTDTHQIAHPLMPSTENNMPNPSSNGALNFRKTKFIGLLPNCCAYTAALDLLVNSDWIRSIPKLSELK
jgi:hypothetical protein